MGFLDMVGWAISQVRDLIATPFGPWIAGLVSIGAGVLWVTNKIANWRARWLILNGDTQVTFKSMVRLLIGGWSQATISAQAYLNMERAIIAQRRGDITGTVSDIGKSIGITHLYNGKIATKMGANGRYYANTGKGATGWTPVPAAMVTKITGSSQMTRGLMNMGAGAAAANAASRGALVSVGRGLLGFGSRIVGLFGGPLGLAITGISIIGPMIYSAIKSNQASNEENTVATNDLASAVRASKDGYNLRKDSLQELTIQEMRWLVQTLGLYTEKLNQRENKGNTTIINIDGRKVFEEYLNERDSEINIAAGVN